MREEVVTTKLSSGIDITASREGLFLFDFSGLESERALAVLTEENAKLIQGAVADRVSVMNAHVICVHTAHAMLDGRARSFTVLGRTDLIHRYAESGAWMYSGTPVAAYRSAAINSEHRNVVDLADHPVQRDGVSIKAVGLSFELLGKLLDGGFRNVELAALLLHAAASAERSEYGVALVTAWAVAEALLAREWAHHLKSVGVSSRRRAKMTDGRDWTAAIVIESLALQKVINRELYDHLTTVRVARNKWAHELRPVSPEQANIALALGAQMLSRASGIHLHIRVFGPGIIP